MKEIVSSTSTDQPPTLPTHRLAEVASLFLHLGFTAFGGPAAHIAMMRREIVQRRKWISDERFVDLLSVINLIPGPNSTQLAIYLGYLRAGWPGLLISGICFIGPAMLIVLALAWLYVQYGALPQVGGLLFGVKAVVIAIIAQALWGLRKTVLQGVLSVLIALAVVVLYLLGSNGLILLISAGLLLGIIRWLERQRARPTKDATLSSTLSFFPSFIALGLHKLHAHWQPFAQTPINAVAITAAPASLLTLFLAFLKLGATLYGSGYVLLAFLRSELVEGLHWLTERQLLDAISIGQFTPGPVFTTATFVGYLVKGWQGALIATLGIFLPSFILIAIIHPLAGRLRRSPWTAPILDGVNIAALALMTGVLLQLGQASLLGQDLLTNILACGIMLVSLAILLRFKINSAWLILAGALLGLLKVWLW